MTLWKKMTDWVSSTEESTEEDSAKKTGNTPPGASAKEPVTPEEADRLRRQVEVFQDILKVKPDDQATQYKLAETWMTLERYGDALKPLKSVLVAQPDHPSALLHMAECYMHIGRDEQAIEILEEARKKNPESQRLIFQLAQAHTHMSISAGKFKRYKEAIQHFKEAIKLLPRYGPAHLAMGLTLYQQGRYDDAIKMFNKTVELDPNLKVDAYHHLARTYAKKGEIKKALKFFDQAIKVNPKAAVVHQDLGEFHFKRGKFEDSVVSLENALSMSPKMSTDAWFKLGVARVRLNRVRAAEEPLRKALEISPDNQQVQGALTEVLYRIYQLDCQDFSPLNSLNMLREAVRLNPTHAKAQFALGQLYDLKKDGKKAIQHLLFARNFFLEQKNRDGLTQTVKALQGFYEKYKLKPEDFEKLIMPSRH